ncbi:MAG: hypothetical protein V4736_02705 [Bdellovibrionota bacterium]
MRNFKADLLHIAVVAMATTAALTGCSLPDPQKSDSSGQATFIIQSAKGTSRSAQYKGQLQIPTSRIYEITACLKDRAYLKPVSSQKVLIQESKQEVWTDAEGCVTFSEKVEFDYMAKPEHMVLVRHLQGLGFHQGSTELKLAVNPWELPGDSAEVIQLKQISLEALGLGTRATDEKPKVFVKSLKIEKLSQDISSNGLTVKHLLRIEPVIERTTIKGENVLVPLIGKELLASVSIDSLEIDKEINFVYSDGNWSAELTLTHQKVSSESKTTAHIKIKDPILKDYVSDSEFNLGLGSAWVQGADVKTVSSVLASGSGSASVGKSAIREELENFIAKSSVQSNSHDRNGDAKPGSTSAQSSDVASNSSSALLVDALESKILKVVKEQEGRRELILSIKTCLKNNVTKQELNQTSVSVEGWNGQTSRLKADDKGCIVFDLNYTFSETSCREYADESISIKLDGSSAEIKIPVLIYPWNQNQPILDARYTNSDVLKKTCVASGEVSGNHNEDILVTKAHVSPLSQSIQVGNLLELNVNRKIRVEVDALMAIQGDNAAALTYGKLQDETWTAEILIKNPWSPSAIKKVSLTTTEVKSTGGILAWDTNILTNDLQTLDGMVEIHIRLQNKSKTHSSPVLKGNAVISANAVTVALSKSNETWDSLQAWVSNQDKLIALAKSKTAGRAKVQSYALRNNLVVTTANPFKLLSNSDTWKIPNINSLVKTEKSAALFCNEWLKSVYGDHHLSGAGRAWVKECSYHVSKDFRQVFKTSPVYEISKVTSSRVKQTDQRQLTFNAYFSLGYAFSEAWREGAEGRLGFDVNAGGAAGPIKGSAGLMGGYVVNFFKGETQDQMLRQGLNESKNILASHYALNFTAQTTRRCMAVQISSKIFDLQKSRSWYLKAFDKMKERGTDELRKNLEKIADTKDLSKLQKGLLFCENFNQNYSFNEDFYILTESRQETSLQNNLDPSAKPWFMSLRSNGDYKQLLAVMGSQITKPSSNNYTENSIQRLLYETDYYEHSHSNPGVWVSPTR